jgi:hypothetical protein
MKYFERLRFKKKNTQNYKVLKSNLNKNQMFSLVTWSCRP